MIRLIVLVGLVSIIGIGNSALADDKPAIPQAPAIANNTLPGSVIDDIEVPNEVLMYVQMVYQGYAVTRASQQIRNNDTVYLLQISRDTKASPHESIFLLYSKDWKLTGQEATPAPPIVRPKIKLPPTPAEQPRPVEQQQPTQDQEPIDESEGDGSEGDRGGVENPQNENRGEPINHDNGN